MTDTKEAPSMLTIEVEKIMMKRMLDLISEFEDRVGLKFESQMKARDGDIQKIKDCQEAQSKALEKIHALSKDIHTEVKCQPIRFAGNGIGMSKMATSPPDPPNVSTIRLTKSSSDLLMSPPESPTLPSRLTNSLPDTDKIDHGNYGCRLIQGRGEVWELVVSKKGLEAKSKGTDPKTNEDYEKSRNKLINTKRGKPKFAPEKKSENIKILSCTESLWKGGNNEVRVYLVRLGDEKPEVMTQNDLNYLQKENRDVFIWWNKDWMEVCKGDETQAIGIKIKQFVLKHPIQTTEV